MAEWFAGGQSIAGIPVGDRGLQYGDGLFETIAIRSGEPRLWHYHLLRLQQGCERLSISMPDPDELEASLRSALRESTSPELYCAAKIIVTAGSGQRGYGRKHVKAANTLIGVFPAAPTAAVTYRDGIDSILCQTRLASNSRFAGLKTLNRLEQVLARSEVLDAGCFEGLTMDDDDNVICGTMSNVFFVNRQSISTPGLQHCGVEGVMRRHILATMQSRGMDIAVAPTTGTELKAVDEVFISNSQFGVLPVRSCGDQQWSVGEVTRTVMASLAENDIIECRL